MDRRQRKTRQAIFDAFIGLLAEQDLGGITVQQILDRADVGRATFYAHFETKDHLLQAMCRELFCHIFDSAHPGHPQHQHIFHCDAPDSVFLHLFQHLQKNDNHILDLLSCPSSDLFYTYFQKELRSLAESQLPLFESRKSQKLPQNFWVDHIAAVFTDTLRWWLKNGMQESPQTITEYFLLAV